MSKIIPFERAAALVRDGETVAVSSSSGLNTPDAMLKALGDRFAATAAPRDLTLFLPIAAGDMYGIRGIDHLAQRGLMRRVIAGSYPSGPSSFEPPRIVAMIEANEVAAYNVPSGILFDMLRESAARRAGVMTQVGLDTFVDPRRQGCRMNQAATDAIVKLHDLDGEAWLHFPNIAPDVAIIRATTADELGNLSMEHEGATLGVLDVALAARNSGGIVIAQVKRVTTANSIPTQRVHVPSTLVDYVVVDPDQMQATQIRYDPVISGEVRRPLTSFEPVPFGTDKVIARRATLELCQGDAVNLGFGISPLMPRILIEEGCADAVTWAVEQGPVGGVPLDGFPFGCAANAQAIMPSPYQFIYFQGAGSDCAFLSFLEVDASGSVNVSRLSARPHVTAGCGGFVDITARARKLVFSGYFRAGGIRLDIRDGGLVIEEEGRIAKFVPEVEHVTLSGRRAQALGQDITWITERCVIRLVEGRLTVTEIAPGIDLERDVLARSGTPLAVAPDLRSMDARLFSPAPMGLELKPPRRAPR